MSKQDSHYLDLSDVHPPGRHAAEISDALFPILRDVSPLNLRILNGASRVIYACKDLELVRADETPGEVYFLHTGALSLIAAGSSQPLMQLKRGDVCAESGVLRRRTHAALLRTDEPCRILAIDNTAVKQVAEADATFHQRLEALYTRRLVGAFIAGHSLLQGIPAHEQASLRSIFRTRLYRQGEAIFAQGEPATGLRFVLAGRVEIRHANQSGAEVLVEVRRGGDMLGELGLGGGKGVAYAATATGDTDVLVLETEQLAELRQRHGALYQAVKEHVAKLAARTAARIKACLGSLA